MEGQDHPSRGVRAASYAQAVAEGEVRKRAQEREKEERLVNAAREYVLMYGSDNAKNLRTLADEYRVDKSTLNRRVKDLLQRIEHCPVPVHPCGGGSEMRPELETETPKTQEERTAEAVAKRKATREHKKDLASQYKASHLGPVGGSFDQYREATTAAQRLCKTDKISVKKSQEKIHAETGIIVGERAIRRGVPPERVGRPTLIPREQEEEIVEIFLMMRAMGIDLHAESVLAIANGLIEDTDTAANFPNGVTYKWYRGWLKRHRDRVGVKSADSKEFDRFQERADLAKQNAQKKADNQRNKTEVAADNKRKALQDLPRLKDKIRKAGGMYVHADTGIPAASKLTQNELKSLCEAYAIPVKSGESGAQMRDRAQVAAQWDSSTNRFPEDPQPLALAPAPGVPAPVSAVAIANAHQHTVPNTPVTPQVDINMLLAMLQAHHHSAGLAQQLQFPG